MIPALALFVAGYVMLLAKWIMVLQTLPEPWLSFFWWGAACTIWATVGKAIGDVWVSRQ